jgi:L-lactate utilization protein LutC
MQKDMLVPASIMIGKIGEYGPLADHTLRDEIKKFKAVAWTSNSRLIEINKDTQPKHFEELLKFCKEKNIPVYDNYGNELIRGC